ncbi:MAG TPA: tetratricopeptide repeat protein [Lacipirellulaceae bacterium]|nr:tetratricopeptide repeat protein [Lacipirellulaceae bacterium]
MAQLFRHLGVAHPPSSGSTGHAIMNITLPRLWFQHSLTSLTGFAAQLVLIFGLAGITGGAELRSAAVKEKTPFELSLESDTWQPLQPKDAEPQSFFHNVKPFDTSNSGESDTEYFCPIHPSIVRDHPDKCPICFTPLSKRNKSKEHPAPQSAGALPDFSNVVSPPLGVVLGEPPQYETARFEEFNITATYASNFWLRLNTTQLNPVTCLTLAHSTPDIGLALVCERLGVELDLNKSTMLALAKHHMRATAPGVEFGKEADASVGNIQGVEYEATINAPDHSLYWLNWVGACNGYSYQLIAFGKPEDAGEVAKASREFRRRLHQIEPTRVAHAAQKDIAGHYKSNEFSYELDLTGMRWLKMDRTTLKQPAADFAAFTGLGSGLIVVATPMPHVALDMDLLTSSVLAGNGLDQPGNEIVRTTPYKCGALECREIEIHRCPDGKNVIGRVRIICDDRCAYVLYAWSLADDKENLAQVQKALDAFGIFPHKSLDLANLPERQRNGCAVALNDLGLRYYNRGDVAEATEFFHTALDLAPSNEVAASNYVEALAKLGRGNDALSFLKDHETIFANMPRIRALQAKLMCQKGDSVEGRKLYAALIADGYMDDAMVAAYIEASVADKSYDEAIETIEAVLKRKPTLAILRWQAELYELKGELATSIKMFETLHTQYPSDIGVALDLTGAYIQAHQYDRALAVTQALIDSGKQDESVLVVHGSVQLRMDRMADAKQTFERARDLYPHSERVNEMLKLASSQLGEGENSCLKATVEAVETPATVSQAIARAAAPDHVAATDSGAEELVHIIGIQYAPGQPLRKTTTQRVKIYGQSGVTRYGTLTYKFDPVYERLYVNQLIVTDEKGGRVAEGAIENYYVTDDTTIGEASNGKVAKIPVPGLKPGYTLECTVTRETVASATEFAFQEFSLACDSPCRVSACFVQGDIGQLKWKTSKGIEVQQADKLLYAVEANTAPVRYEPHQPSIETFTPMVWIGPADTTWETEGQSYLKSIDAKLQVDDETKAVAADVTRECKSKREKLAAIAEHVQQACSYHAIEFGRRARIPNASSKTLALNYGDCKDHALLTRQLLAAVGIQSHLTLVRSTSAIVEELPSLDQFDHMIVFVPSQEVDESPNAMGGYLVDATNKDADPLLEPPCGMGNRSVLVLDPAGPTLIRTPKYPSDAGKLVSARTLTFDIKPSGAVDSHVTEEVTLNAYLAPGIRGYLKRFDADGRREAVQNLLSENGPIRVKKIEALNLDSVREPLRLNLEYVIPNSFHTIGSSPNTKALVGNLPCAWENEYVLAQALDCRKTPFEIATPRLVKSSLKVNLPYGYGFDNLEQCDGSGQSEFRSWASRASKTGNTVNIEYQVRLAAGRHPAPEYEQFCTEMNESLAVLLTPVTLGGQASPLETASRSTQPEQQR